MGCECVTLRFKSGKSPVPTAPQTEPPKQSEPAANDPFPSVLSPIAFPSARIQMLREPLSARYLFAEKKKIFRAELKSTRQQCVIKVFAKPEVTAMSRTRRRLKAFAEEVTRLDHPSIVKVYEVLEDDDNFYVSAEALTGGSLSDLMSAKGQLSEKLVAKILHQVLGALHHCHTHGIVHKSINLDTVMLKCPCVDESPAIALIGFGEKVAVKQTPGSCFFAPEVFSGSPTEKSDIWSCGVLLHTLLSGKLPLTDEAYMKCVSKKHPVKLNFTTWKHVNPSAISLISSMLSWNVKVRPSASAAYQHNWFKALSSHSAQLKPIKTQVKNLMSAKVGSFLREAVKHFVVFRILTQDERMPASQCFQTIDTDGDGFLSHGELLAMLKRLMPEERAVKEAARVLKGTDINQDGVLEYSEYLMAAFSEADLLATEHLVTVFNAIDSDYSGTVTVQEMKKFFKISDNSEVAEVLTEEIETEAAEAEIDFDEFCEIVRKGK